MSGRRVLFARPRRRPMYPRTARAIQCGREGGASQRQGGCRRPPARPLPKTRCRTARAVLQWREGSA